MNTGLLIAAFAMGFLGSPHCLGMCGGIVSAFGISMQGASATKKSALIGLYHTGRMASYMILGAVSALVGTTLFAPFVHSSSIPRVAVGAALVFVALLMLGVPMLKQIERLGLGLWGRLSFIRTKLFPLTTAPKALGAGLLWGFLPCGLVYGAMLVALSAGTAKASVGSVGFGVVFMLFFGLGTIPMLVVTQGAVIWLQTHIKRFSLRKVSGMIMLISGLMVAIPALTLDHSHHHPDNADHAHHNHAHNHNHSQH